MEKAYWLNKWKLQDIAFHEQHVTPDLITYFHYLNLQPGHTVFVPLCGKTKDMLWLVEKGCRVVGVELSEIACHDFFAELKVAPRVTKQANFTQYQYENIELLCGDLFVLTKKDLPRIDAVYDCKALIALPSDIRKKYVEQMIACLGTHIKILLITRESQCQVSPPPFPIDGTEVNLLYGSYFDVKKIKNLLITKDQIPEHLTKKGYTQMFESVYLMTEKKEIRTC